MRPRKPRWMVEKMKRGETLQELAFSVGFDISTLSKCGNGWVNPSPDLRAKVAQHFGMSEEKAWAKI